MTEAPERITATGDGWEAEYVRADKIQGLKSALGIAIRRLQYDRPIAALITLLRAKQKLEEEEEESDGS